MDPFIFNLRVLSYNLHGLNQGATTLHELCNNPETGLFSFKNIGGRRQICVQVNR